MAERLSVSDNRTIEAGVKGLLRPGAEEIADQLFALYVETHPDDLKRLGVDVSTLTMERAGAMTDEVVMYSGIGMSLAQAVEYICERANQILRDELEISQAQATARRTRSDKLSTGAVAASLHAEEIAA